MAAPLPLGSPLDPVKLSVQWLCSASSLQRLHHRDAEGMEGPHFQRFDLRLTRRVSWPPQVQVRERGSLG